MEGWRQGPAGAMGVAGMGTAGEGAGEWLRLQGGTQNHSQAQGAHPLVTPLTLSAAPLPICAIRRDVLKPHGAGWVEGCPDSGLQPPAQLFSARPLCAGPGRGVLLGPAAPGSQHEVPPRCPQGIHVSQGEPGAVTQAPSPAPLCSPRPQQPAVPLWPHLPKSCEGQDGHSFEVNFLQKGKLRHGHGDHVPG